MIFVTLIAHFHVCMVGLKLITTFLSMHFSGEKAVDCLMESKWTKEPKDRQDLLTPHFKTRANAVDYCIQ